MQTQPLPRQSTPILSPEAAPQVIHGLCHLPSRLLSLALNRPNPRLSLQPGQGAGGKSKQILLTTNGTRNRLLRGSQTTQINTKPAKDLHTLTLEMLSDRRQNRSRKAKPIPGQQLQAADQCVRFSEAMWNQGPTKLRASIKKSHRIQAEAIVAARHYRIGIIDANPGTEVAYGTASNKLTGRKQSHQKIRFAKDLGQAIQIPQIVHLGIIKANRIQIKRIDWTISAFDLLLEITLQPRQMRPEINNNLNRGAKVAKTLLKPR